jgi:circadian clock protein KaiB
VKKTTKPRKAKTLRAAAPAEWDLRLYVAGPNPRSIAAFRNLEKLCDVHLAGRYHIAIIDLLKTPQLAQGQQILALPALVRHLPSPIRKVVGDLSNEDQVLVGLDLQIRAAKPLALKSGGKDAN